MTEDQANQVIAQNAQLIDLQTQTLARLQDLSDLTRAHSDYLAALIIIVIIFGFILALSLKRTYGND